ncbi:MAG: acetoacetyl-CoA synthetase [Actinomycetes bacterium]|jgi:acetoacetyl-CoA synthetase
MDRLRREVAEAIGLDLPDSRALYDFSLEHPGDFWDVVWGECGVVGDRGDGPAYVLPPAAQDMRAAKFFPAASLNYAANILAGGERVGADETAIIFRREDGVRRDVSWHELRNDVSVMAAFFVQCGVTSGDRVAAWMPNVPETVIAMLAAASVGATFSSTSPDFGVDGILDRFGQVSPTVLIAADGYVYGNRRHDRLDRLRDVVAGLPSLRAVVVHGELEAEPDVSEVSRAVPVLTWPEALQSGSRAVASGRGPSLDQLYPFDTPLYILYSSGTTGVPKCIVHRAGGVLIKHLVEQQLHSDIRPGDRVFYFTTCGWMMWNWLVSALASGATIVLYDGSPFHPKRDVLWDLAQSEKLTFFGTSAKFIDASLKAQVRPVDTHSLTELRTIASTGSPLSEESFEYVYRDIASDVHLASISGGTDLCGCLVLGDPTRPVYAGQIQTPALGMAIDVWDNAGRSLRDIPGEHGDLVVTAAFPSMPLGFWDDPDGSKYDAAYFQVYDGTWAHGDFASWTEHGGVVIHGRSDATLNSGGVRIGTAEIYRQVEQLPQLAESLAIGQRWEDDTRIVLFVRLAPDQKFTEDLITEIRSRLREHCSPRHVPAKIIAVADLPRTRSGKLAELAVADVVHGRAVRNSGALANPEVLAYFEDLAELAR